MSIEPGQELANGATVIAKRDDNILAHWNKGGRIEFVNWKIYLDGPCFWGIYSRDLHTALETFEGRD